MSLSLSLSLRLFPDVLRLRTDVSWLYNIRTIPFRRKTNIKHNNHRKWASAENCCLVVTLLSTSLVVITVLFLFKSTEVFWFFFFKLTFRFIEADGKPYDRHPGTVRSLFWSVTEVMKFEVRFVRSAHELVNGHFQKSTYASFKKKCNKKWKLQFGKGSKRLICLGEGKKRERKTLRVFFTTNWISSGSDDESVFLLLKNRSQKWGLTFALLREQSGSTHYLQACGGK